MALLTIREIGDPILNKKAKTVKEMTPRLKELVQDMLETMYESNGVGLAAPQVGVLKRIVVIDVSPEQNDPHVFINPQIVEATGEQEGYEGCLSIPGKSGWVKRPQYVKTVAYDENMNQFEVEGVDLFARCMCHEFDHLDGILYVEKAEGGLIDNEELERAEEEEAQKE
ncbi:MAG: peptide deformylase [Lachnospiraceae bacterium]|jgi:peptide deformylase|nr:peptide deformylase [Lachnospiraceae bacterium]